MPTKEEDFKQRFVAVLQDLQTNGKNDPEAMWLIGSLAAELVDRTPAKTWTGFKRALSQEAYARLLSDFQSEGNKQYQTGEPKKAYAIQVLGISLVALTQNDPQLAAGDTLLDHLIETTMLVYRQHKNDPKPKAN